MRKVEAQMIQAIRDLLGNAAFKGDYLKVGNTKISQSHFGIHGTYDYKRIISVRLHDNEIAAFYPIEGTLFVSDCGWQTATTKSRLNALLGVYTQEGGISQVKYVWRLGKEAWNGNATMRFALRDCWQLQQAEKLAR
jgi:hypothetical protein